MIYLYSPCRPPTQAILNLNQVCLRLNSCHFTATLHVADAATYTAAKKKRKNKKKANDKSKDAGESAEANGARDDNEADGDEAEAEEDADQTAERVRQITTTTLRLHPSDKQ